MPRPAWPQLPAVRFSTEQAVRFARYAVERFGQHRLYDTSKIRRDIPVFNPKFALEDAAGRLIADLDRRGLIPDAREDDTEDRIVAGLGRLRAELTG